MEGQKDAMAIGCSGLLCSAHRVFQKLPGRAYTARRIRGDHDPSQEISEPGHREAARVPLGQAGILHHLCVLLYRSVPAGAEADRGPGE